MKINNLAICDRGDTVSVIHKLTIAVAYRSVEGPILKQKTDNDDLNKAAVFAARKPYGYWSKDRLYSGIEVV